MGRISGIRMVVVIALAGGMPGCVDSSAPGLDVLSGVDPGTGGEVLGADNGAVPDVSGRTDPASGEVAGDVPVASGCQVDADCQAVGACPDYATLGCGCAATLLGAKACMPKCVTDADCSAVPTEGVPLACGAAGLCAYGGGTNDDTGTPTDVVEPADPGPGDAGADVSGLAHFSFFVTSLKAIQAKSGSPNGFGGDLRYGFTGANAGLLGADKICSEIAEGSMEGAGSKEWRAFLSATDDGAGNVVNAIDRIGEGPWYDRLGRVFALQKADLLYDRPSSANVLIKNDFPNEDGVTNHRPILTQPEVDNHDFLTGTNAQGKLYSATATCRDWTSVATNVGKPRVGHSWPRSGGGGGGPGGGGQDMANWMSALDETGCKAGINLVDNGAGDQSAGTVGAGGGYGGFYCFALTP